MQALAELCDAVAATSKKSEKIALVANFLHGEPVSDAALAAQFLSARPLTPAKDQTMQVGGALLWRVLADLAEGGDQVLHESYSRHRDLGSAAYDALLPTAPKQSSLSIEDVAARYQQIADARSIDARANALRELLAKATALEAKYIVRIMTGEMRIGFKESLVEEAIARAFDAPLPDVKRANMLVGDPAEVLRLAASGRLRDARLRLFHPIGLMLATPAESAEEAFSEFSDAIIEDKYDGIRAQAHVGHGQVRLFSRTQEDVTAAFPDLVPHLLTLRDDVVLDGEILAWRNGNAMAFSALQTRLGRKRVSSRMMSEVPVAYVAFDLLARNREPLLDSALRERQRQLNEVLADRRPLGAKVDLTPTLFEASPEVRGPDAKPEPRVLRAPAVSAHSPEHMDELFSAAQDRGNEGLMIKDANSPYTPGRRGRTWLKLKRELATLDVVVTAVEYGHGKRASVLSDYTFAVRHGERLVNIGKAYTGLTDAEIAEMTEWFTVHTLEQNGSVRQVEPTVVVEVAFNAVMRSDRHGDSGFALRFPRIVRLRPDKPVADIDTLETVEKIYRSQHHVRHAA
jgi:DNA ligase-1